MFSFCESAVDETLSDLSITHIIQVEATEQYFPVVLFIIL